MVRVCRDTTERSPTDGCRQDDEEDQEDPHDQAEADHVTVVVLLGASRKTASASLLSPCLHSLLSTLSGRGPGGDTAVHRQEHTHIACFRTAQRSCNNRITLWMGECLSLTVQPTSLICTEEWMHHAQLHVLHEVKRQLRVQPVCEVPAMRAVLLSAALAWKDLPNGSCLERSATAQ